jgi:hypothetical protein
VLGWSDRLLPTDRPPWSDYNGTAAKSMEEVALPDDKRHWDWVDEWHVDSRLRGDAGTCFF